MTSPLENKDHGNSFFQQKQWFRAIDEYSKGLAHCDDETANDLRGQLLCNRSQCWLNLQEWRSARDDACACLQCMPGYAKAFFRCARASEMLGRNEEAFSDFLKVVRMEPQNKAAVDGAARLQLKLPEGKNKLLGWTRLCYSDFGTSTAGSTLNWDLSLEEVRSLAKHAMRVRIQTRDQSSSAVVSKPNAYPIENIRLGQPIGFGRGLGRYEVGSYWESESPQMLESLWHLHQHWNDHGHRSEVHKLETNVYWAACNQAGLHWHGLVDGGYLRPLSTWTNARDSDLELYIDAVLESAETGDNTFEVLVRNLAGEEIARMQIPARDYVCQVRERTSQACGLPIHRIRLIRAGKGILQDRDRLWDVQPVCAATAEDPVDNAAVGELRAKQQHLELQLVLLPLDPSAGSQLAQPALDGDVRIVRQVLNDLGDPNFFGETALTPLSMAAQANHLQVVRLLLDAAGTPENLKRQDMVTPLFLAAMMGHVQVVSFLCESGANKDWTVCNHHIGDCMTAVHAAATVGHAAVIRVLSTARADINKARADGKTALIMATYGQNTEVVRILCAAGADKEQPDSNGCTPLQLAANHGFLPIAKALCHAGAAKNTAGSDGSSPLLLALDQGHEEVARFLCEAGADKDRTREDGCSPLLMAAKQGCTDLVCMFLESGSNKEQVLEDGYTALHLAAQNGHSSVVQTLCKAGLELNRQNNRGQTPLMISLEDGQSEAAQMLREAGAQIPSGWQ